jgi:DNA-binding YbaB/EbfC family protein
MTVGFDMEALFERARAMQDQLVSAPEAAARQGVEGQSGGGAVKVRVTGAMEVESVSIDPAAVDPDDVAMLEDLVRAACNDALGRAGELSRQALGDLDLGQLGLGDTGGGRHLEGPAG